MKKPKRIKKVFLGGTCNDSKWRYELIPMLDIDYFNPVVDDWTEECYQEELKQREICDYCLYVITPRMTGVYSIAEVVDDSNKRPNKTILCVLKLDVDYKPVLRWNEEENKFFIGHDEVEKPFNEGQMKSLERTGLMVERNGGKYFKSLEEVASYLNKVGIEK
nr:MAG TPA: Nucleoside 2-deoxyribosyltransferase like protein [Caudoviricetes sp.]